LAARKEPMKIVYGPIISPCLGKAIAVDPIGRHPKACSFNCVYCRLGSHGIMLHERAVFIEDDIMLEQIGECEHGDDCCGVLFKGTGDPFLASNIFSAARKIKEASSKKVGVMTNCSLLGQPDVLKELDAFDVIIVKLDAATEGTFQMVNRPHPSISFSDVLSGIREARLSFHGSFRMRVTLVRENLHEMGEISRICREMCPDYLYLNLPELCDPSHQVSKREAQAAWEKFNDIPCISQSDM